MGTEDPDVSARLLVKCLLGYSQKCPKLQILPEKGLTKKDADQLLSLLVDQANINAREGRVMIFNLVEAAQEFLSEIVPVKQSLESVHCLGSKRKDQSFHDAAVLPYANCRSEGLFVYGSIDLYSDLCGDDAPWSGDDAPWSGGGTHVANRNSSKIFREHAQSIDKNRSKNILLHSALFNINNTITHDQFFENTKPEVHATKPGVVPRSFTNLDVLEEEAESNSRTRSPSPGVETDTLEKDSDSGLLEGLILGEKTTNADSCDSEGESLASFVSLPHDNESQTKKKDLLMVHLIRLACSSKGSIAQAVPEISSELYNLGVIPEWARDLAVEPPSIFNKAFDHAFGHHVVQLFE